MKHHDLQAENSKYCYVQKSIEAWIDATMICLISRALYTWDPNINQCLGKAKAKQKSFYVK